MAKKTILVKPIVTEKASELSDNKNQYTFLVNKKANKIEIRKAVEDRYNVAVASVNTLVMPGKVKSRGTRTGFIQGRRPAFKKAVVTLEPGEYIDLYGDI